MPSQYSTVATYLSNSIEFGVSRSLFHFSSNKGAHHQCPAISSIKTTGLSNTKCRAVEGHLKTHNQALREARVRHDQLQSSALSHCTIYPSQIITPRPHHERPKEASLPYQLTAPHPRHPNLGFLFLTSASPSTYTGSSIRSLT